MDTRDELLSQILYAGIEKSKQQPIFTHEMQNALRLMDFQTFIVKCNKFTISL